METKQFHLGDVLSITTRRLVSLTHMNGINDILNFMTGDDLFTHQLPRAQNECLPHLFKQFPQLDSPTSETMAAEIDRLLAGVEGEEKRKAVIKEWLALQTAKYGEILEVAKIPAEDHEQIDPHSELVEMVHPDKIIKFAI